MTILMLSRLFYPHIGGVERHVMEVSKRLVGLGHRVIVITELSSSTGILVYQYKKESDKSESKGYEKFEGMEIYRIPVGENGWFKKFRIWRQLWKLKKLIRSANIIHCHDVFFWYLPFRFLFPTKKVFVTFHGYEGNMLPTRKAIFMHRIAEKLSFGNVCVGKFLEKWYGTNATAITYGAVAGIKNQESRIRNNRVKNILFIGRLEEETGILEYLKSLMLLQNLKFNISLTVLGDGSEKKECIEYAKKNGVKAVWKGFVEDPTEYFDKTDIIFVSRYLGILEALAGKKPVFALYNNPIKKDYLYMTPFAQYISISSDAEDLAKNIEESVGNKQLTQEKIDNGYLWVKNQTWEKLTDTYLNLWINK